MKVLSLLFTTVTIAGLFTVLLLPHKNQDLSFVLKPSKDTNFIPIKEAL